MFFLLILLDDGRIRIRIPVPLTNGSGYGRPKNDPDPEQCLAGCCLNETVLVSPA